MKKTMDKIERIKFIKAMEFVARNINDEAVFEEWLLIGVADGDIKYGSLNITRDDFFNLDYYITDENFADLMRTFLHIMARARKSGGLCCDQIVSKE